MRKLLCGVVTAMLSTCVMAADGLVLAVPARQMVWNFGFDMMEMAPDKVDLVCYGARSGDDDVAEMEIDLFDPLEARWGILDREDWAAGEGLRKGEKTLIVVGTGAMAEAVQRVNWTDDVRAFQGERLDDIANAVGTELAFTAAQWRSVAKKYGFTIEDHNAELRRIGRRRMRARQGSTEARPVAPSYPKSAMGEIPTIDAPVAERRTSAIVMPLAEMQSEIDTKVETTADAPAVEIPAVEAPAPEAPAVETPAVEAPAVEAPTVEAHTAETPAVEAPAAETPAVEVPAAEAPVIELVPVTYVVPEASAEAVPAVEAPVVEAQAEPAVEAPAETPAQESAVPMIVIRPVTEAE